MSVTGLVGTRAEANRERVLAVAAGLTAQKGLGEVTVRRVAGAAGLATGSLRYVFASQHDLFAALADRVRSARQSRLDQVSGDVAAQARASIEALAPLDAQRREEVLVHLALVVAVDGPGPFAVAVQRMQDQLDETCATSVTALTLGRRLDRETRIIEGLRLASVLTGLALVPPGPDPATRVRAVIERHLDDLMPDPAARGLRPRPLAGQPG